ncbi:hypothetical protein ACX80T_15160 [Arthrobacter sp. Sr33]
MSNEQWNVFMEFAAQFAKTVDLDTEEYNYKIVLADRLRKTREGYLSRDPEWFEALRRDISSSNLMNRYFMMRLIDLGRSKPGDLRQVIDLLWDGEPDVRRIDDFAALLRPHNPEQFSVGGIIGFASILLLARDPLSTLPIVPAPSRNSSSWLGGKTAVPTVILRVGTNCSWNHLTNSFGWRPSTASSSATAWTRKG